MGFAKYPVPKQEMERRHEVTTRKMKELGIDCLIMYSLDRMFGSALRYLTGHFVTLYPMCGMFSAEGDITVMGVTGNHGETIPLADDNLPPKYNVGIPIFPNTYFTNDYAPEAMRKIIVENNYRKVGYCHLNNMPAAVPLYLEKNLPDVEFVDASEMISTIMAVKSPWELEQLQHAIDVQERMLAAVPSLIIPGRSTEYIGTSLRKLALDMECEEMNVMVGCAPNNTIVPMPPFLSQHDTVKAEDNVGVLIEVAAPGGYWAETSRIFCQTNPTDEMKQVADDALMVQKKMAELAVPGATTDAITEKCNEILTSLGVSTQQRFFIHGQGYDIVQSPLFVPNETMILQENMFLAIHPYVTRPYFAVFFVDNFVVGKQGARRMAKFPQELIRI